MGSTLSTFPVKWRLPVSAVNVMVSRIAACQKPGAQLLPAGQQGLAAPAMAYTGNSALGPWLYELASGGRQIWDIQALAGVI